MKQKIVFVLSQKSWDCWLPPFLVDNSFESILYYFDPEDSKEVSEVAEALLSFAPDAVVLLSHHTTLQRDTFLADQVTKRGIRHVIYQPPHIAALAADKRAMTCAARTIPGITTIPELSCEEARSNVRDGKPIVCKLKNETEGNGFQIFKSETEFIDHYFRLSEQQKHATMLQPFIEGDEYSIAVVGGRGGVQIYEPVFKQSTSLFGIHPCKRRRLVPHVHGERKVSEALRDAAERFALFLECRGLLELEFVCKDGKLFFLELNPRLAATMRMIAMASPKNLFCELVHLEYQNEFTVEQIKTTRYAAELPRSDVPPMLESRFREVSDVSISSRVTICHENLRILEEQLAYAATHS